MMLRLAILFVLCASVVTFQPMMPRAVIAKPMASPTALNIIMSDEETDKILKSAKDCADGECSIDDVSDLILELKEQQATLQDRMDKIMNTISHLQHLNEKPERKTDEVRALVKDMLRVFAHEKAHFTPAGYSGDSFKGTKTAWDVLPPKKWKPKP